MFDRTMTRGWLKVMLGLGTPNAYDMRAKETRYILDHQDEQRLLTVDIACPNEANKTEKQAEKYESTNSSLTSY